MSSILTNTSAMVALQTLKGINNNLNDVQNQISTGKAVGTAKDNAAVWAISKVMESDVQGFKAISSSLSIGESTVAVARSAAETTTDLLQEMKEKVVAAQDGTLSRAELQKDVVALKAQMESVTGAAQFNGVNLVDGDTTQTTTGGVAGIDVISSLDRSEGGSGVSVNRIEIAAADLSADGTIMTGVTGIDLTGATEAELEGYLGTLETAIEATVGVASSFGSVQNRIEIQSEFVSELTDSLKAGIGSMVDANMEEASARLQALQVQQQLGTQSLSIANQAPQSILSLFR